MSVWGSLFAPLSIEVLKVESNQCRLTEVLRTEKTLSCTNNQNYPYDLKLTFSFGQRKKFMSYRFPSKEGHGGDLSRPLQLFPRGGRNRVKEKVGRQGKRAKKERERDV